MIVLLQRLSILSVAGVRGVRVKHLPLTLSLTLLRSDYQYVKMLGEGCEGKIKEKLFFIIRRGYAPMYSFNVLSRHVTDIMPKSSCQ
ncbi:MAG TPA: hypothetical protein DEQ27_01545 [Prevotella sp.]|nr:hypothetical protein [Prevotella sp.]